MPVEKTVRKTGSHVILHVAYFLYFYSTHLYYTTPTDVGTSKVPYNICTIMPTALIFDAITTK